MPLTNSPTRLWWPVLSAFLLARSGGSFAVFAVRLLPDRPVLVAGAGLAYPERSRWERSRRSSDSTAHPSHSVIPSGAGRYFLSDSTAHPSHNVLPSAAGR